MIKIIKISSKLEKFSKICLKLQFCVFYKKGQRTPSRPETRGTFALTTLLTLLSCSRDTMPSHFKFKEYCPLVFRYLRERFSVDETTYLVCLTPPLPLFSLPRVRGRQRDLIQYFWISGHMPTCLFFLLLFSGQKLQS